MSSVRPRHRATPVRRLPLAGVLRLNRPSDIWFKPALSVVVAVGVPNLTLLALGRLDLALYSMAGSLCALYAHNLPYAARSRALAQVVLGMLASVAIALVTASLTSSAVVLVAVGALLAAAHKAVSDLTRIGPPGPVIFTFISSASLFAPQTLGQVPGHLALAAGAGAWAWLVGMAPGLLRPHGPERRATARALNAAAGFVDAYEAGATSGVRDEAGHERARAAGAATAAAAVHAAWQSLLATGARPEPRRALERLVVRAEVALAAPADTDAARLRTWARDLRGTNPVPRVASGEDADELLGVETELRETGPAARMSGKGGKAGRSGNRWWTWNDRMSPLLPLALRTALGCALAGYVSLALGVGRPYWALVTAASLYQANLTLTWSRGVQRVVGNLVGVLLFAAVAPLAHLGPTALVLCCLAFNFGAEALITRNYWLGSICVTPMALLITEFTGFQEPGGLMTDRVVDTLVGAVVGFVAAVAVTNRRAADRIETALDTVEYAREHAARLIAAERPGSGTGAGPAAGPATGALEAARRRLAAALVELRATADAAAGEWWQRALPQERMMLAEQAGHRTLAATVRRQGPHVLEDAEA
ncbi:FUSC family protein [Streptomyces dioscori]|uniref:FUSC family protein n=1 Tax=Streptomyces dioscori TaxID=2109333 RepID=UPI00131D2EDE|nr:FUSC family protein [Streptomyces dioscori]